MSRHHALLSTLPEYPRWVERMDAAGLAAHRPALEALLEPTIALDVLPDVPDGVRSRLGGLPDLPPDHPWPTWQGAPLAFVAQLHLDEALLACDLDRRLPRHGLLSLFVQLSAPDYARVCALRWFPDVQALVRREAPGPRLTLPGEAAWSPRLALSVPRGEYDAVEAILTDSDASDAFHDEVCLPLRPPGPDHRLFGLPSVTSWLHHRGKRFVLQVDSDDRVGLEMGDVETLRVYAAGDVLDAAALDTAQCTLDEE